MVAGVSNLGVTFGYGVETTAGTKPGTFTKLTRINKITGISVEPEKIDASALEDSSTKNISGRDTVSDTMTVTVNTTDATITEWEGVITAYQALTDGKRMWFEIITPGITKAEFVVATPPTHLPISDKEQNSLNTMDINLTVEDFVGFDTKVSFTP